MSQGPDNYIWQSYEEWLCNVIAENYPFSSISGRLSFSEGWHFISAVPSILLGSFPGGPPTPPCPRFLICLYFLLSPPEPPFLQPLLPPPQLPLSQASGGRYKDACPWDAWRMARLAPEVVLVHVSATCFHDAVATFVFVGLKSHGKGDQEPVTAANAFPIVPYYYALQQSWLILLPQFLHP